MKPLSMASILKKSLSIVSILGSVYSEWGLLFNTTKDQSWYTLIPFAVEWFVSLVTLLIRFCGKHKPYYQQFYLVTKIFYIDYIIKYDDIQDVYCVIGHTI